MQTKWPWFERKFTFDFPPEKMPDILTRLEGTPARIASLLSGQDVKTLTRREKDTWSIQENVGHLADLEPLWIGRVNDILAGHEIMREVDLSNQKTFDAKHHDKTIDDVQQNFVGLREQLITLIKSLKPNQYALTSLHPRLREPMRIVDLCCFVAEHDDYHLARIMYLKRS